MASSKALTAANLESLGAKRLADLLVELSAGDTAIKRRLRLALAGNAGSAEAAREISKRLASIARAKSYIDWQKVKPLVAELEGQRRAILDLVAPTDPREAFELLWQFVKCAEPVYGRSDDGSGRLGAVFQVAAQDLGPVAKAADLDPMDLARRAFQALSEAHYGEWDTLVPSLAPQLGAAGLRALQKQMAAWKAEPAKTPPEHERRVIGWSSSGKIYEDELQTSHRRNTTRFVLQEIADALGDVDGYIAQFDQSARKAPAVAAGIAKRLLEAGRPSEAWGALEAVDPARRFGITTEWEDVRLDTFEALGRGEDAQAFRWERFLATLNASHLRAYLRKLPDFEDIEAEERALAHGLNYRDVHQALSFLVSWPELRLAAQLVLTRPKELNGDFYELLTSAADTLEEKHPLAATLLRRAMIDFTLSKARLTRYKHAARHFVECANLAEHLGDFGDVANHTDYESALQAAHGRKSGFWQEVKAFKS
ncbi:DUF6880 family protein [Acidisphaera sp. L21]|uniref:DUF6880 family protein n=1 Tax=Acidisphaera sp. L21 TaxID=1641851 RepID=UPI00131CA455|nr:DUF6880 family protein [Acidisphaera sp. L21]